MLCFCDVYPSVFHGHRILFVHSILDRDRKLIFVREVPLIGTKIAESYFCAYVLEKWNDLHQANIKIIKIMCLTQNCKGGSVQVLKFHCRILAAGLVMLNGCRIL